LRYFVVREDGQMYGPADLTLLNVWSSEGRIDRTTLLQNEMTGGRLYASELTGLHLMPTTWTEPPPTYAQYPRGTAVQAGGQTELILSFVFSALGLGAACFLIGPAVALYFGEKAASLGNPGANAAKIFARIVLILHVLLAILYCAVFGIAMSTGL
jgi:hypothetical protein